MKPAVCVFLMFMSCAGAARAQDPKYECIAASMDAQTSRLAGRLLSARTKSLACARDECPDIVRAHCAHWLTEIVDEIPSLVVRAQGHGGEDVLDAKVTIDGSPATLDGRPVDVDPGEHVVAVEAQGHQRKEERVLLAAGERARVVTLVLAESPPPLVATSPAARADLPSPTREPRGSQPLPTGVWILGGVGVAALTGSALFALAAQHQYDLVTAPRPAGCSPDCTDQQTSIGRAYTLATYTSLGVGLALSAGAVIWALMPRDGKHAASGSRWRFGAQWSPGAGVATFESRF